MSKLTIEEIGRVLADSVDLETHIVCVSGSEEIPESGVRTSSISGCIASAIYQMATGEIHGPLYAGYEQDQPFCRCMGGPAWFGYRSFDHGLMSLLASGSEDLKGFVPKRLKKSREIAQKTISSIGKVVPLGRYVVMSRCEGLQDDRGVRCLVCFASGEQIRNLCALAHFASSDVFNLVSIPRGPSCATMITYPAGMAENAPPDMLFVGPSDPSASFWLPKGVFGDRNFREDGQDDGRMRKAVFSCRYCLVLPKCVIKWQLLNSS